MDRQTDGWTGGRTIFSRIRMIHVLTKFYYPWCSTIKLPSSQLAPTVYSPTFIVHDCMPHLLYFSFMKDFKRKGQPSLLDNLKTHNKFPLLETFLETITEKSNKVGCCLYMSVLSAVLATLFCLQTCRPGQVVFCFRQVTFLAAVACLMGRGTDNFTSSKRVENI